MWPDIIVFNSILRALPKGSKISCTITHVTLITSIGSLSY